MSDTPDRLLDILADEEGLRMYVYDDATGEPIVQGSKVIGHPTIWIGLCVAKGRVPKLWESLPRDVLKYVAAGKYEELLKKAPWILGQPDDVRLALQLMAFQLGADGVLGFKNMLESLRADDRVAAAAHALDSEWARDDTPARARRVAALIRGTSEEAAAGA